MIETKEKPRVLNLGNDYLFKALFRSIEAREMVALFLSKITGLDEEVLLNADYIGGEIPKKKQKEKAKTSDVIVKITDDCRIILECNSSKNSNLFRKNTSYAFANYIEYSKIGKNTSTSIYPDIYLVNIDMFTHFKTKEPISLFTISNNEGDIEVDSYKSYHFILDNALNKEYNKDEDLYRIALFLNANAIEELEKISKDDERFMKAYGKVEEYMSNDDFLIYYDKEEMNEFEKKTCYQDGLNEGRELGISEGRELGISEGRELGISEGQKEIIKNMISNGITISEISKMVNISEEEIRKLID